ncbi:uncharacterized protein DC041_0011109 [Schistosoma bovis]|uniref:Glycolipid transfer protein domain-containing protein n=1 Tax=Schistosoma bovis TaxID=6184 RepID=A0A430QG02_SCHBO|nr:uncharacterized protein DC041_0011109 [Schistosoma bovis]
MSLSAENKHNSVQKYVTSQSKVHLVAPPDEQLKVIARSVYDKTLSQYHPWPIRKAVGVAVYALPTREHLVHHIVQSQPPGSGLLTNEQCAEFLTSHALPVMRKVNTVSSQNTASAVHM